MVVYQSHKCPECESPLIVRDGLFQCEKSTDWKEDCDDCAGSGDCYHCDGSGWCQECDGQGSFKEKATCSYSEPVPADIQMRLAGAPMLPGLE